MSLCSKSSEKGELSQAKLCTNWVSKDLIFLFKYVISCKTCAHPWTFVTFLFYLWNQKLLVQKVNYPLKKTLSQLLVTSLHTTPEVSTMHSIFQIKTTRLTIQLLLSQVLLLTGNYIKAMKLEMGSCWCKTPVVKPLCHMYIKICSVCLLILCFSL